MVKFKADVFNVLVSRRDVEDLCVVFQDYCKFHFQDEDSLSYNRAFELLQSFQVLKNRFVVIDSNISSHD